MTLFEQIRQFNRAIRHPVNRIPCIPHDDEIIEAGASQFTGAALRQLRRALLNEEHEEYKKAESENDLVGIADALGDMIVIIVGTAAFYGIPLEEVLSHINLSNDQKIGPNGVIYRNDGKVLKPEGWQPPNIAAVLRRAGNHD